MKPGAREALAELDTLGIRETVMLTGDREHAAASVAKRLGLTRWFAGLCPRIRWNGCASFRSPGTP